MASMWTILLLAHLFGLALALGAASVKLALLLRCRADPGFVPTYLGVYRAITRFIILGLAVLTLSGVGWLLLGYPLTTVLVVKLVLVGALWVLGPVIDKVAEPRFVALVPAAGEAPSPEFLMAGRRYLAIEAVATGTFYVVVMLWVLQ